MSEDPSVTSQASSALVQLQKLLAERGVVNKGKGSLRKGMRPIYAALEEMDRVGVKVQVTQHADDVVGLEARNMRQDLPLHLGVWDTVAKIKKSIKLREYERHEGEYVGVMATVVTEGPIWWPINIEEVQDHVHFNNAEDAVEWLVEQLAPCVVEASGLDLTEKSLLAG
jgi:hypothetical protein